MIYKKSWMNDSDLNNCWCPVDQTGT